MCCMCNIDRSMPQIGKEFILLHYRICICISICIWYVANPVRVSLPREGECAREQGLWESLFKRVQRGCIHNAITKIAPLRYSHWVVGVFNNITGGTNCLVFKWVSSGVPKWFLKAGGWHCDEPMGDAVHERQSVLSSGPWAGLWDSLLALAMSCYR